MKRVDRDALWVDPLITRVTLPNPKDCTPQDEQPDPLESQARIHSKLRSERRLFCEVPEDKSAVEFSVA